MEDIHRRIPHRPPFLFIDEILNVSDSGAEASLTVKPEFPFFEGHYPGNPIMPGVLLCESVFQTGAVFLADLLDEESLTDESVTPVLSRIRDARFKRMVLPGDKVDISVSLTDRMGKFFNLTGQIKNEGKVCLTISFALALVKDEEKQSK
ncbi:MAG: beta-hydroxyacyl-ACP dehydratase [Opitutae bacterium]|jgi:3-hydroxyacyl-[acyl-carrier-protein] dehydratase|nr:beta-hydroxyacyl-ACP dehydratase [Opitutae bacterium]